MVKLFNALIALIIGVLLCLAATSGKTIADSGKTLKLGWDPWTPYQYTDDSGKVTGLDIELITMAFQAVGYALEYEQLPWVRCLLHIERGVTDMAGGACKTPEREEFAYFSDPVRTENVVLFTRAGESAKYPFASLSDMVGGSFRLGVTSGYYYGELYAELIQQPAFKTIVQEVSDNPPQVRKLIKNRIDGFLMDPLVGKAFVRQYGFEGQVEIHPMSVFSEDVFVMFSKKSTSPEIVAAFNRGLKQIKENGMYAEIFKRYAP